MKGKNEHLLNHIEQSNQIKLNNIISLLLETDNKSKIETQMSILFELMIWAQKKNPDLLFSVLQTGTLQHLISMQTKNLISILKAMILLLGNCVQNGLIISHVLSNGLVDNLLEKIITLLAELPPSQQLIQYIGSFLKSYSKHYNQNNAQYFIKENRCLIAQTCCYFYNCSEKLTQTSVMNILMSIFNIPASLKFIMNNEKVINQYYANWAYSYSIAFYTRIISLNKELSQTLTINNIQLKIQQINDLIALYEDFTSVCPLIFIQPFQQHILYPILFGPINQQSNISLTLKFSLWIICKLMNVWKNLNLTQNIIEILFLSTNYQLVYCKGQTSLAPFALKNLSSNFWNISPQPLKFFKSNSQKIRNFYLQISRTKDNQFLSLQCQLITYLQLNKTVNQLSKQLKPRFSDIVIKYMQRFIEQLKFGHTVQTTILICQCIIQLWGFLRDKDDSITMLVHIYRQAITEVKNILKSIQIQNYLIEVLEYDVKHIENIKLGEKISNKWNLNYDVKIFNQENQNINLNNFYQVYPTNNQTNLRYKIIKFFILYKIRYLLIQGKYSNYNIMQPYNKYFQLIPENKDLKLGNVLNLPIKQKCHECKLIQNKKETNILLIENQKALIVGDLKGSKLNIIMSYEFKHIIDVQNNQNLTEIKVNSYDYERENIIQKPPLYIKGLETINETINNKKNIYKQKSLLFLNQTILKASQDIPQISLL